VVALVGLVGVEAVGGFLEAVPLNEPHGVERPAAVVGPQAVDRDDARVLQPAGDLGLEQETGAACRVVGVLLEDLLEGHLAVQLLVEGDEDGAQAAAGVRPQDTEPLAVTGRGADGQRHGAIVVGVGFARARAGAGEGRLDVRAADPRQALLRRPADRNRGQALLDVAAVGVQVNFGQRFQKRPLGGGEVAARFEVVGQAPELV
jgi:hypothetical protein